MVVGLITAGYSHSKAIDLRECPDVRVIYRTRRTNLVAILKRQSYVANDPIFDQFTRLGSNGSGTVCIASFGDGYSMSGGFFYIADYVVLFDYEKIDGIVEKIWQGPIHIHVTVAAGIKKEFARY